MSRGPIAVVTALAQEMRPLARRLDGGRRERVRGHSCRHGRLGGRDAVLAVTGVGLVAAGRGATAVLEGSEPALLLGLGVAGGLSPALPRGDVVVAEEVVSPDGASRSADPEWLHRAQALGSVAAGTLVSADRVVGEVADKRELWRRLGEPPTAAVDLESAAWAEAAATRRVPWLVLRAISDAAGEPLPLPFARLASPGGGVSRGRVLAHLALRPGRIPAVLDLRRRVGRLAERLAELAWELLA